MISTLALRRRSLKRASSYRSSQRSHSDSERMSFSIVVVGVVVERVRSGIGWSVVGGEDVGVWMRMCEGSGEHRGEKQRGLVV